MARSSTLILLAVSTLLPFAACAPSGYGSVNGVKFDLCQPLTVTPDPTATADQMDGIAQGMALWNQLAGAHLVLAGDPTASASAPSLPLHFQHAAGNFHGLYDPSTAQVFINNDLTGHPRTVTITHELGHSFGLVHISPDERPSVMNPANLTIEPTAADVAALAAIWGTCSTTPAP